jgi:ligand-binding SRPBCC domain-containing protein
MAYQPDESVHPFWEHTSEYAARNEDTSFMGEVAYVLVTLYKSEVPK